MSDTDSFPSDDDLPPLGETLHLLYSVSTRDATSTILSQPSSSGAAACEGNRRRNGSRKRRPNRTDADIAAQKEAFLAAYQDWGNIRAGVEEANKTLKRPMDRRQVSEWRESDSEFAGAFAEAKEHSTELLEIELRHRALDSKRRDTIAMIFQLKALRPTVYRDNVTVTHEGHLAPDVKALLEKVVELSPTRVDAPNQAPVDVIEGEVVQPQLPAGSIMR